MKRYPEILTLEFKKVDRGESILVDTGRNEYSATFAATYTVRAKDGAPISAPCTWEEVEAGEVEPQTLKLRNMEKRIRDVGDLWSGLLKKGQSLKRPIEKLRQLI